MATTNEIKTTMTATLESAGNRSSKLSDPIKVDITRLPTEDTEDVNTTTAQDSRSTLHIYFEHDCGHKLITPTLSPPQERRWGPKPKEQKARRLAKKAAKKQRKDRQTLLSPLTPSEPTALSVSPQPAKEGEGTYFLHTPYLSFHLPPSVLYIGGERYAPSKPVALVHTGWFWRSYKIQLGPSLSLPGVIDPRGVVSWRHNGGDKKALKHDDTYGGGRLLKGYQVRGWRLWGETGKAYVYGIRDRRRAGEAFEDPDMEENHSYAKVGARMKVHADEVVYLTWTHPLSLRTRLYTFHFRGVEFQWKGTGTVNEGRKCGWMLRFCHLKLVAKIPVDTRSKGKEDQRLKEVCLGKYTSSIAAEKSGTLQVFDCAVVRFAEEHMRSLLDEQRLDDEKHGDTGEDEEAKIARLKKGILYQLIVATALCMVNAEKEKRHTLMDLIIGAAENAGNGGG